MALVNGSRLARGLSPRRIMIVLGIFGSALLYADGALTPAISVLSAVEGLELATPALAPWVIPVTLAILVGLFLLQSRGTARIGAVFGPVMLLWFGTIGALGLSEIVRQPGVLAAVSPSHAVRFFAEDVGRGFIVLGAVFLVVTGGEALYADLGHFGHRRQLGPDAADLCIGVGLRLVQQHRRCVRRGPLHADAHHDADVLRDEPRSLALEHPASGARRRAVPLHGYPILRRQRAEDSLRRLGPPGHRARRVNADDHPEAGPRDPRQAHAGEDGFAEDAARPSCRRAARHGRVAGEAVRVHVAQRAARDRLLQDPGEPGVRGRSPGRAVADARALHPWTGARYR